MQQQQQHEEEQPPQWARGAQQVGQRPLAEEQQHVQPQQVQGAHLPLPERCLPEQQQQRRQADTHPQPQLPQPPKLAPSHPPHLAAEDEGRQQTATAQKEGPFLAPTAARRRLHTHSDAASKPAAPASVQPQQARPQHGAAKPVGVDCHVPFISSAISATSQKQPPPPGSLGSTASAASPSSPGASSVRERHAHFRSTNVAEGGAPGEGKEDEENNSHSTRSPSHNSSCQRLGDHRREEGRGGAESAGDAATYSRRSDTQGLHVAEAALGLHLPEEAFADAAVQSSSLAASQSGPSVGAAPAPAYQWECRLGDDVATGGGHDSAGLPVLSSSFYSNVFSSEATSESAGSFTSPAATPPAASSPYAASPPLTASPASVLSARGSRSPSTSCAASSADVRRASLSTAHDNSSGPGISQTQEHAAAEEPCSTSVPPTSFVYDRTRARTRGRTASYQQGKTRGNSQAEKKPRSSSTGGSRGSHSNYTSDGYLFSMNSPRQSSSASSARGYSAAVSSPSAAAFSTSASSSSSRSAATFPYPSSSAAVCHSTAASPSDSASHVEAVSSAALTPAAAARGSFTGTSPRRSSWGRQLNGPGDAVEILVDKCIYRQQNVKRPEQSPVLLPNGEPLPGLRVLYNSENQLQRTPLSPAAAFAWHGPMALPYNAEEVPPSPFSKGTGSQGGSRGCTSVRLSESGGLPQVPHRRGSAAAALAAMRIPSLFSPPHHSSAKLPRSACNAVLNHADFSPPSPFFSVASRSSAEDAPGTTAQHPFPYPQVAVRTCAVHQQLHTFVYPFTVDGVATESAAAPSTSASLFYAGPQPAAAEPQKPVLTYCISNNGMGEALPYSSRGATAKQTSTGSPWLRWLWPWRKQHALSSKALQQHHQQGGVSSYDMQDLALSLKIAPAVSSIVRSSSPSRPAVGRPSPSSAGDGGSANSGRKWRGFTKSSFPFVRKSSAAASPSADRRPPAARMVPAPHGSSSISSCEEADGWRSRGRGTFVLAAVSAALEIGCVWRFPSYCFKFGGATFLLAYVVLLLVLGVPVLALEMALGQVFRGGQMKVLNLISPRLRGLAAATLLLSFFICAYYSIFISWTLQFLFSSIRPSLPWSITSQEAAICAAAGHDAAACSRATLPTPFSATQGVLQQQLMESYMGDQQQQQQLGKQKQLQQALRRLNAHRPEGGKKKKSGRQNKEMQQSFCAWQKPADGNSAGVCVADDKLKARTFLYTDVTGLWVKTTERLSSVPGVFFRAAADDHQPPAVDPSTGGGGTAPSVADTFPATGDDAGLAEEGAAAIVSSSAAPGESSPLPERAQQELRSSGFSARRLAPHAAAADTSFSVDGASPRVTSVAVAASLWNLTPLVAVGLAAVWMQIYLFSLRGYKPTTTFTYVTAVTPILAMLLIAGLALSLDGASLGLRHLFSPSPHVFSSASFSTNDPAHAAARKLDGHFMAHDTSASAVRSAGALPRRISDGGASPEGATGERAHTAASAGGKAAGNAGLEYAPSAAAAPAPLLATTARGASQKAVAAPVTQLPRESSTNSSGSDDFLSFIFPFWPQWLTAGSHTMWGEAAAQVFFSLGVFQGVVTAYASHKHLTENVLLDAAAAAVTNLGMSLLAAIATFAVAGHVAKRLGAVDTGRRAADLSALQDVQGSQLVFVLYPLAFASLPRGVAQVTCILCFLALLLLGLTSVVGLVQPVLGLLRRCLWMEKYPRWKIAGAVCAVGLLIGLPFCARGGLLLVEAADYRWTVVGLVFIGCCESIAFGWLYGVGRQAQCIGYLPLLLHGVTYWLAVLLAAVLLFLSPPPHNAPATAFAVSISVAAVGAAAALWCCPWEGWRRKKQRLPAMQQSYQDGQKETKKQEQVVVEPRQQQAQQQPAKRKGKPQTGTAEKSRVKFTNGCADSSSGTGATTAVVGSSSSTQRVSNNSNAQDVEEDQQNQSCSTSTNNTRDTGNGHTSSYGAAPASPPSGSIAHSSRQGSGITASHSSDSRTGRTGRQVNEVNGRNACSNSSSAAEEPSAERSDGKRSSDPDTPSRLPQSGSSSVDPASGSSSSGTKKPAVTGNPSIGVESNVTGAANFDNNVLDGRDSSEVGESSDAVPVSGSGTSDASVANSSSSSSSGNDAHGRRRQRGDPGVVLDTPKASGAGKSSPKQQQQQTRYRSPRSRSSRRRREGRGFVFIKRDGETLPFLSCVFWLFVGNVEHLRKNLNAITCSGYRVLRLWPPWSIVIRYVIPTILMLLVVQELPQLFVTISRYTQPPPAGVVGSSRGAGIAAAIAQPGLHTELQQRPAAAQEHYVQLRHSRPEEEKEQQQQARQSSQMLQQQLEEEEEEKLKYRSVTPAAAGASWRSLVTIQVFTLGALLLVVGLVVLGLLLPHAWDVFIPKERRRHGLNVTSAGASSFRSLSSRGSPSCPAADNMGTARVADVLGPHQQQQEP